MNNERTIILTDWQARAAADGRLTRISVPVKPQPEPFPGWWKGLHWASDKHFRKGAVEHCPYRVGTVLVGKETYKCVGEDDGSDDPPRYIVYRADGAVRKIEQSFATDAVVQFHDARWRSVVTMHSLFSRHRWTVTAVSARRVGEITQAEIAAEGLDENYEYLAAWQSRYGDLCPWPGGWVWVLKLEPEKA